MSEGIHFMALEDVKAKLKATEEEYKRATIQLDEALRLGDLSENAEYDTARETVRRVANLRDELSPALTLPAVRSNDNVKFIEEGSIIELIVWSLTETPVNPNSAGFQQLKQGEPEFKGVLMFGATMNFHELLVDKALSAETEVGKYILGKQSGDYSVPVPGGFSNITVTKLSSSTSQSELYCEVEGRE